jgi:hypothetical protein
MLCRVTLADTNGVVVELLRHLKQQAAEDVGTATERFLADQTGDSRRWPLDDEVIDSLQRIRFYAVMIPRRRGRMVLEALEDSYRSPKTEEAYCLRGGLTVEHLMPVSWQANWSDGRENDSALREERNHRVQTLGNLSLLTSRLNPSLSNNPWIGDGEAPGKRDGISQHSVLMLNKHLLDHQPDWTDDDIEARSRTLAERVTQIWTRPTPHSLR